MRLQDLTSSRSFLIACSIPVRDVEKSLELADKAISQGADLVEFRVDYYTAKKPEDYIDCVLALTRQFTKPKIVTLREVSEGGVNDIPSRVKITALRLLHNLDCTYVDIELDFLLKYRSELELDKYSGVIVSRHYFYEKPSLSSLVQMYNSVREIPNIDIFKVAVLVSSQRDLETLLTFLCNYGENARPYLAVLPMSGARRFRVIPLLLSSKLTYCSITEETAPGQIPLDYCVKLRELLEQIWQ